jgi:hypothetical protein
VGFVSAVLGYPARSKILQGFSSPDEVSNDAKIGDRQKIKHTAKSSGNSRRLHGNS